MVALDFDTALEQVLNSDPKPGTKVVQWRGKSPGIEPALLKAFLLRNNQLKVKDVLEIALLARRYSFNRFR
jgi:hypothetical protein